MTSSENTNESEENRILTLSDVLLEEYEKTFDLEAYEKIFESKKREDLSKPKLIKSRLREELKKKFDGKVYIPEKKDTPAERKEKEINENERLVEIFDAIHNLDPKRSALCLSGGGIRSATFCLGIIQGLARHNLLGKFNYLSTVSGGGYIGGWLTAWIKRERAKTEEPRRDVFKILKDDIEGYPNKSKMSPEPKEISHLRAYSNFLTPRVGLLSIDTWTLVAIYLRNLFLNWLVLVPFILGILLIPRMYTSLINKNFGLISVSDTLGIFWALKHSLNVNLTHYSEDKWIYGFSIFALILGLILGALVLAYISSHRPSVSGNLGGKNNETKVEGTAETDNSTSDSVMRKWFHPSNETSRFWIYFIVPLLSSAFFLTIGRAWWIESEQHPYWDWWEFAAAGAVLMTLGWLFTILEVAVFFKGRCLKDSSVTVFGAFMADKKRRGLELIVVLVTGLLGGYCLWLLSLPEKISTILCLSKVEPEKNCDNLLVLYAWVDGPVLMLVFLFMGILSNGIGSKRISDDDREWWARSAAYILIAIVIWTVVNALVILIPNNLLFKHDNLLNIPLGLSGLIAGFVTLLFSISSKTPANNRQAEKAGRVTTVLDYAIKLSAPIFTAFLVVFLSFFTDFLIVLIKYLPNLKTTVGGWRFPFTDWNSLSSVSYDRYDKLIEDAHTDTSFLFLVSMFIGLWLIAYIMGRLININQFSLHSLYRNRLTRTYLGASRKRNPNSFTDFDQDDDLEMSDLQAGSKDSGVIKPFHLVNMTWNLVNGKKLQWQNRMATSFTMSPLHCGNFLNGYRRSNEYGVETSKSKSLASNNNSESISLGTALTISGAAASPNMGYYSSTFVTILMTLFNARLGWWLGNPQRNDSYKRSGPKSALGPMLSELSGRTAEDKKYIYLSDGGHFENLGLYEMVLRRCHYIFVVDASRDPDFKFENLGNAIRRVRVDLGINIEIDNYPRKQDDPSPYCAIGTIYYSEIDGKKNKNKIKDESKANEVKNEKNVENKKDENDGILIYIKPSLIGDEPTDIFNYAQDNIKFPHEPTSDMWFSEEQFESYRALGLYAINQIFKTPLKDNNFSNLETCVKAYIEEANSPKGKFREMKIH